MPNSMMRAERPGRSMLARLGDSLRSFVTAPKLLSLITLQDRIFSDHGPTLAGVSVSEHTAFMCSAFWDGVNQISSDVAKIPLNLMKRTQDGGSEPYVKSNVYRMLKYSPNPEMRSMVARRTITAWALVYGNGYAEIERNGFGDPVALWPLHPNRVQPYYDKDRPEAGRRFPLRYRIDGGKAELLPADIIHLQGIGCDGVTGYNLVDFAREALGLALASEKFAAAFFGNGTRFGGILSSDQDLDPDQKEDIRKNIEAMHASADKAFRILVLEAGMKFDEAGTKPSDAEMSKIRDMQVVEIARFLNMPPHKLKQLERATFSNIEQQDLEYYKGPIMNWATLWEEELNAKLISPLEQRLQYIKHNVNAFLRGDTAARTAFYSAMLDRGVFNADTVLELEDQNPQPNGQGKLFLVQGAMVPKDKLSALADANIEKAKQPKVAPAPPAAEPDPVAAAETDALRGQLAAAEAATADALVAAQAEREARMVLEATGEATAAQLAEKRENETRALAVAAQMTATVDELRQQLERAEAFAREVAVADATKDAAVAAAEGKAAEYLTLAEASREAGAQAEESARLARADAESARAEAEAAVAALGIAEFESKKAGADRESSEAARAEAERLAVSAVAASAAADAALAALQAEAESIRRDADAAQAQAAEALTERDAAVQRAAEAEADSIAVRAELEAVRSEWARLQSQVDAASRLSDEARVAIEAMTADLIARDRDLVQARADLAAQREAHGEASAAHLEARESVSRLERERADAEAGREQLRGLMAAESEARSQAETALRNLALADVDGQAAQIAAHRALMVDTMRRMIERETDRVRRASQTPERLAKVIETFYEGHEDLCRNALLPVVRVHCAFVRAVEDPVEATRRWVGSHIDESKRQILTVLEGDADDIAASLPALLHRWETDRVTVIADALMQRELQYAKQSR